MALCNTSGGVSEALVSWEHKGITFVVSSQRSSVTFHNLKKGGMSKWQKEL
jgi:hypothetical protein